MCGSMTKDKEELTNKEFLLKFLFLIYLNLTIQVTQINYI